MTTLQDAVVAYKTIARADGKSEYTIAWVVGATRQFEQFLGDGIRLEDLTPHDMRCWIAAMRERKRYASHAFAHSDKPLSATTINNYVRGIKLLLSTLAREDVIPEHPVARFRAPKIPTLTSIP